MKRQLLGALLLAAGLAAACAGSSDDGSSLPDATATTTTAQFDADQVITLTKEFSVLYKVDNPDGTFELKSKLRQGTEVKVSFPRKRVMEPLPRIVEPARWLKDRHNSSDAMGAGAKT